MNTRPNAYCDTCLATALGIDAKTVARETRILAGDPRFQQARLLCDYCGSVQTVISAASS